MNSGGSPSPSSWGSRNDDACVWIGRQLPSNKLLQPILRCESFALSAPDG